MLLDSETETVLYCTVPSRSPPLTPHWTDSTLDSAWNTILSQCDEEAYSRSNYAESMQMDVVEALKVMTKRMDALRAKVSGCRALCLRGTGLPSSSASWEDEGGKRRTQPGARARAS